MQNMKNKKFKAIFFDKDGVLLDSVNDCLSAFNETLKHYGEKELNKEEYIKEYLGFKAESNINKIFNYSTKIERKKILYHYMKKRAENKDTTKLFPLVIPILKSLKGTYKLGVITNTIKDVAIKILKDYNIYQYFDIVIGGDQGRPKPAPDPILKACNLLDIQPAEAVFVGDTLIDVTAGKEAGCTTMIVTTSKHREELAKIKDIFIIDDLIEILTIIEE